MLTGAGLVARSLERLGQIPLGYRSDHLSLLQLAIPVTRETAHAKLAELADQATARWRTDPNVVAVTPSQFPPFLGAQVMAAGWEAEGELPASAGGNPTIPIEIGDADYFRTFDVPILRGRGFLEADREHTPPVVVVSDAVARLFWPGKDPIGRRIHIAGDTASSDAVWRTVVGVAGDIRYRSLRHATPTIYLPWHQADATTVLIAVRTRAALARVLPELRRELVEVDPRATVVRARTMDELLAGQLALPRFNALLLTSFGLVALLLVATGLYGVMASVVREETHEIGVPHGAGGHTEPPAPGGARSGTGDIRGRRDRRACRCARHFPASEVIVVRGESDRSGSTARGVHASACGSGDRYICPGALREHGRPGSRVADGIGLPLLPVPTSLTAGIGSDQREEDTAVSHG